MKILHTNDWHVWHRTPASRLDNWPETIFGKLDQIAQIAEIEHVDVIAVAGDIFHSVHVPYWVTVRLLNWAERVRAVVSEVVAIPGNHDERFDRRDSLPTTPMGALFQSGLFRDVSEEPFLVDDVQFVGLGWPEAKSMANWVELGAKVHDGPVVALGHTFASKTGGQIFKSPVLSYGALAALPIDVFHFGHDHSGQGTMWVGEKLFLNFGALGRGSLAAEELTRDLRVAITTVLPRTVPAAKFVRLKYRPSEEVFDLRRYAFEKQIEATFEAGLAQQISDDVLAFDESRSLATLLAELTAEASADVKARVQAYITAAEEAD